MTRCASPGDPRLPFCSQNAENGTPVAILAPKTIKKGTRNGTKMLENADHVWGSTLKNITLSLFWNAKIGSRKRIRTSYFRVAGTPDFRASEGRESGFSGCRKCGFPKVRESGNSRIQEIRISGMPDVREPGFQDAFQSSAGSWSQELARP
jgi:hypothetical protein